MRLGTVATRLGALLVFAIVAALGLTTSAFAATAGSYHGKTEQNGNGVAFYVSASGTAIQDILVSATNPICMPGLGGIAYHLGIAKAKIESGKFKASGSQTGIDRGGVEVKIADKFEGEFSGDSAAGVYSEKVTYTQSGVIHHCALVGKTGWSASRDVQPTQTLAPPPSGGYAGNTTEPIGGNTVSVPVLSGGKSIQEFALSKANPICTPSAGGIEDFSFKLSSIAIKSTGEFVKKLEIKKPLPGNPAIEGTFQYWASGRFHGTESLGKERVAGMYREKVTFADKAGVLHKCDTLNQSWWALQL
jgi:hypothetical protein